MYIDNPYKLYSRVFIDFCAGQLLGISIKCFYKKNYNIVKKKQEKKRKLLHSLCRYTSIKGFGIIFLEGRLSVMTLSAASSNSHLKIAI